MHYRTFLQELNKKIKENENLLEQQKELKEVLETIANFSDNSYIQINDFDIQFDKKDKLQQITNVMFTYYGVEIPNELLQLQPCDCGSKAIDVGGRNVEIENENSPNVTFLTCKECGRRIESEKFDKTNKDDVSNALTCLIMDWNS